MYMPSTVQVSTCAQGSPHLACGTERRRARGACTNEGSAAAPPPPTIAPLARVAFASWFAHASRSLPGTSAQDSSYHRLPKSEAPRDDPLPVANQDTPFHRERTWPPAPQVETVSPEHGDNHKAYRAANYSPTTNVSLLTLPNTTTRQQRAPARLQGTFPATEAAQQCTPPTNCPCDFSPSGGTRARACAPLLHFDRCRRNSAQFKKNDT